MQAKLIDTMKETLSQLAHYNIWANKRIIDILLGLDEELLDKELVSSFPSVRSTVYHIWSAEFIWLQRLQLTENPVWIAPDFKGTFAEACEDWQKISAVLASFVDAQYDDKALQHVLQYYDRQKKSNKKPVYVVLIHIFNHASYHRGQLVTMLRQLGINKIPGTDFIGFEKK